MRRILSKLALACSLACAAHAALVCLPSVPVAGNGETVHITVYGADGLGNATFSWSATGGKVQRKDSGAEWTFSDVSPETMYSAKAVVKASGVPPQECTALVASAPGSRGARETARALLARDEHEETGFGLYSYLLLGSKPDDSSHERYLNAIKAHLRLVQPLAALRRMLEAKQINATYLPVVTKPNSKDDGAITAEWLLENYDYAKARAILKILPGSHLRGPYVLSTLRPADPRAPAAGPMLFQDYSAVPPALVSLWYEAFLNQAAQERFWEANTSQQLALKLRTILGVMAAGLPDVKAGIASWIQWLK